MTITEGALIIIAWCQITYVFFAATAHLAARKREQERDAVRERNLKWIEGTK